MRRRGVGSSLALAGGLTVLAALFLLLAGHLLLVRDVARTDPIASVVSAVLAVATATAALVAWWWEARRRRRVRAEEDARTDLADSPVDHWVRSARGSDEAGDTTFFTGRGRAFSRLDDLRRRDRAGLAVVLGMPGAGKSALLSVLVLRSARPDDLPAPLRARVPDLRLDAAVHASGKDVVVVVDELARAFALRVDAEHAADVVKRHLAARANPAVIVVDALDEATEPAALAELLTGLSWNAFVVVGTRPEGAADDTHDAAPPRPMRRRVPEVVDLSAAYLDADEVAEYVGARLRRDDRDDGYGDRRAWPVRRLRDLLALEAAHHALGNYLVAQMIADELLSTPALRRREVARYAEQQWPHTFAEWMKRDIARRLSADTRTLPLVLVPLAYAERDGLTEELWAAALRTFRLDVAPADIPRALERLGFYVGRVGERSYVLRHRRFADHFRDEILAADGERWMLETALANVPAWTDGRRDWPRAGDYARRHALAHAARAHRLDRLLEDEPECLAAVDPVEAAAPLATATSTAARIAAAVGRSAAHAASRPFDARLAVLGFHATLDGARALAEQLRSRRRATGWATAWRGGGAPAAAPTGPAFAAFDVLPIAWPRPAAVVLTPAEGHLTAAAIDLDSQELLSPPIDLGPERPDHQSALGIAGNVYLLAAWDDGHVRVWCLAGPLAGPDPVTALPTGHPVRACALLVGPRDVPLLVTSTGADGTLLRPVHGGEAPLPAGRAADRIVGLPCTGRGARALVSSLDGGLRVIDVDDDTVTDTPVVPGPATLLAAVGDRDASCALVSVDGTVRLFRLDEQPAVRSEVEIALGGPTTCPALTLRDNVCRVALPVGADVLVFDAGPVRDTVATLDAPGAHDVAFVDEAGTMLAVAEWSEGLVRVVDLVDGAGVDRRSLPAGGAGTVVRVARGDDGECRAVTRTPSTGLARTWVLDPLQDAPARGHATAPRLLAAHAVNDRVTVAVAAGPDVLLWTGDPTLLPSEPMTLTHDEDVEALALLGHRGRVLVAAAGDTTTMVWSCDPDGASSSSRVHNGEVAAELAVLLVREEVPHLAVGSPDGLALHRCGPHGLAPVDHELANAPVRALTAGADGRLLVGDEDGRVHVLAAGEPPITLQTETDVVGVGELAAVDGRRALWALTRLGTVHVWTLDAVDAAPATVELPVDCDAVVAAGPGVLALNHPSGVVLWPLDGDAPGPELIRTEGGRVTDLATVGTGDSLRVVAVSSDGTLSAVDPRTGQVDAFPVNTEFLAITGLATPSWLIALHGAAIVALDPSAAPSLTSRVRAAGPQ